ncbi:hypothetical protein HNQ35_001554 [Cerasibacillus quisquiliarum]|uniref:Uncharacterized protein n=1 Tax=Cerasibacillus quisquiliarum TaxID=227865 RepID=A0A511UVN7_9BACI|nr:hypothetical protein [Cerasibacillus quisquiliarum]GEN30679.1 hypothetical protein CQU01_09170 [Cerasibacillus quisquiliarum]
MGFDNYSANFFFRIVGIFILGENDIINVDGYLNSIISFLSSAILFVALGMILIGLLFRIFNKLISHPAYSRWSNRLFLFSGISIVLSIVVKPVLLYIRLGGGVKRSTLLVMLVIQEQISNM